MMFFPFHWNVHRATSASSQSTGRCAPSPVPDARRAVPPPTQSAPGAPAAGAARTTATRFAASGASWGENSATWRSNLGPWKRDNDLTWWRCDLNILNYGNQLATKKGRFLVGMNGVYDRHVELGVWETWWDATIPRCQKKSI